MNQISIIIIRLGDHSSVVGMSSTNEWFIMLFDGRGLNQPYVMNRSLLLLGNTLQMQ